ncbi:MAG: hypothetical protein PUB42_02990 [Firmicutes bacterium]|nr:hypothetical protein [Bacillota bacterium]
MKNTTHRVVILHDCKSNLIAQAILILKDSTQPHDTKLIAEAEKIVEKYMSGPCVNTQKNSPPNRFFGLFCAAVLIGAGILALIKFI